MEGGIPAWVQNVVAKQGAPAYVRLLEKAAVSLMVHGSGFRVRVWVRVQGEGKSEGLNRAERLEPPHGAGAWCEGWLLARVARRAPCEGGGGAAEVQAVNDVAKGGEGGAP